MAHTRSLDELLTEIFEHKQHPLTARFTEWLTTSKRFRLFAETYRAKIRAKMRNLQNQESLGDLAFELATAYWLLKEPRLTVAYEPHDPKQTRRPDFSVTFTTKFTFSVEVTRIRPAPIEDPERESSKLQTVIANKFVQTLPGMINLLVIGAEEATLRNVDLAAAVTRLKQRAEAKDVDLLSRSGLGDLSEFFRHYERLSGILLRSTQDQKADRPSRLWVNKAAKHPLPANLQTMLKR